MTKHHDHDGSDPLDSPLAGMLTEAMARRHHQLRNTQGSIHDVRLRARRITRRRTAVGAGALVAVGAVGAIAVARNGDGGGQRLVAGGNGGANDAAAVPGGGGYWECTGPLSPMASYPTATLVPFTPSTLPLGSDFPATTVPGYGTLHVTTTVPYDETQYSTTTPGPYEGPATSTTYPPPTTMLIDPTSTTIDFSASTSTVDPGLATATSFLPSVPVPSRDGGVYYMSNCTFVDGSFAVDTAATTDTYPADLEPQTVPPTIEDTDTVVAGTSPAVDLTAPPTVADTEFDVTPTTSPGG